MSISSTDQLSEFFPLIAIACRRKPKLGQLFSDCLVELSENGAQAIEHYQELGIAFDLAVIDLLMPEMNGLETTRRLQAIDPNLLVVLMTGYRDPERLARHEDVKLATTLDKPFRGKQLIAAVCKDTRVATSDQA